MIDSNPVQYTMTRPPSRDAAGTKGEGVPSIGKGKARIVIVEDDFLVGMTSEDTLLEAGYEVLDWVSTGEEAVERALALRPDLVLMDIRLAGAMTGIEAALALHAHGIPSLFASAHSDAAIRASGEAAQPAGWLTKPFTPAELTRAVAAALAGLGSG